MLFEAELTDQQIVRLIAVIRAAGCEVTGGSDIYTVKAATGTQVACLTTAVQILIGNHDLPKVHFQEGGLVIG